MKKYKMRFTPEASRLVSKFHPENKKQIQRALQDLQKDPLYLIRRQLGLFIETVSAIR